MPGTSACFEKKSFGVMNDLAKTEKSVQLQETLNAKR